VGAAQSHERTAWRSDRVHGEERMSLASRHAPARRSFLSALVLCAVGLLLCMTALAGCDDEATDEAAALSVPGTYQQCNQVEKEPSGRGEGMGPAVRSHWSGGRRAYDESADMFACLLNPQSWIAVGRYEDWLADRSPQPNRMRRPTVGGRA